VKKEENFFFDRVFVTSGGQLGFKNFPEKYEKNPDQIGHVIWS
jgi:hypothetical protein